MSFHVLPATGNTVFLRENLFQTSGQGGAEGGSRCQAWEQAEGTQPRNVLCLDSAPPAWNALPWEGKITLIRETTAKACVGTPQLWQESSLRFLGRLLFQRGAAPRSCRSNKQLLPKVLQGKTGKVRKNGGKES